MIMTKLLNASRPIGTILMDSGLLTPECAEQVIKLQKAAKLRFGEAAVRLGLLTESDIQFALSKQFDYSYLPLAGDKPVSEELVAAYQPFSDEVEQLRALRSQLLLRWFDKEAGRKCLVVVGTDRGEGRSFLAANLAIVFSQLGEHTLLIDADMRAPRQHELFKLENEIGLSSLLGGRSNGGTIVSVPAFANLAVLPAGPVPPNPLELLNRPTFERLLEDIRTGYDVVLIDTPGTASGADADMIASRVGAALVVARRNQTRVAALAGLVAALLAAGVTVVGSVLNAPSVVPDDELQPWSGVWH
jgi:receptor protein-tyrosine kinase